MNLRMLLIALLVSCAGPGQEGDPCAADEDCDEGLVCDVHDSDEGTCVHEDEHED